MAKPSKNYSRHPELVKLGEKIRKLRREKGYSQESFALEMGLDRSYLGGIERGEHNITVMNLIKISNSLGVSISYLFEQN